MTVKILTKKEWIKDGWKCFFYDYLKNLDEIKRKYKSKKYFEKIAALKDEKNLLTTTIECSDKDINMTFNDLYMKFYHYKEDKVKFSTLRTYKERKVFLKSLDNIKLKDFDINIFEKWKQEINSYDLSTNTKNYLFKFLKILLNYATKWYNFNFTATYNKMTNFTNPNEIPKETQFFTYEEFKQFISVVDDVFFKAVFETLYYCGLRCGELRGLTWDNIDFKNSYLSIRKNVVSTNGFNDKAYLVTTPKTKSSIRDLPIPKVLLDDLKILYDEAQKKSGFNDSWYVFGSDIPLTKGKLHYHKKKICKLAGVKEIRIHDFRHSCASLLINNNASIMVVAKYLGHTKTDETLNTYSHLFKNQLAEIVNIINRLN